MSRLGAYGKVQQAVIDGLARYEGLNAVEEGVVPPDILISVTEDMRQKDGSHLTFIGDYYWVWYSRATHVGPKGQYPSGRPSGKRPIVNRDYVRQTLAELHASVEDVVIVRYDVADLVVRVHTHEPLEVRYLWVWVSRAKILEGFPARPKATRGRPIAKLGEGLSV